MELKYIDIGLNLMGKQFDSDRETVAADSFAAGVGFIVTGTDLKSDRAAVDYLKKSRFEHAWCTCGIHPHNADRWDENYKKQLLELIQRNRGIVAAVGEAGLDYDRMFSTKENQKRCFSDILDIAERLELPLFLHERSAEQDFIKLMKQHQELCRRSVVHCFTGSRGTAYRYLQMGCYIGITGWICDDRRNREVVEAVKSIPLDRLMIETDAPYLTPLNIKGLPRRNVPVNIKYVAEKIAAVKNTDVEAVEQAALRNTRQFFNL
ncbi:TatD family hydrolase [Hungatella sp.]|uniref:TatD family hydrolase n=1 Tax=Hungatella sp. TaxID=2613924 RepID=UPI002A836B52|nr:TatD family hydrolase [Hungatella sp.]